MRARPLPADVNILNTFKADDTTYTERNRNVKNEKLENLKFKKRAPKKSEREGKHSS